MRSSLWKLDNAADAQIRLLQGLSESLGSKSVTEFPVPEIIRVARRKSRGSAAMLLRAALRLAEPGGPLRTCHALTGDGPDPSLPRDENAAEWLIGLAPEVFLDLEAVRQRVEAYGEVLGAVNLLGRGLEKTAEESGTVLGLDCGMFFPQIRAVREQLLTDGPLEMGRTPLPNIPPMRVAPDP